MADGILGNNGDKKLPCMIKWAKIKIMRILKN